MCRGAPNINYLLFTDDSLIFCKENYSTSGSLQNLLKIYERVLGQSINVVEVVKDEIKSSWGGSNTQHFEKYLGFPPLVGRSRKKTFTEIKTKLWQKLQVWKEKLSQGGKETY